MPTRRWGMENIVNTATAGTQWTPAVAGLAGGGFVVVWADVSATHGIRAQRFDALGNKAGGEIAIATGEGHSQPAVTGLADGGFYVTWTRQVEFGTNYIEGNVYGADGAFLRYQPVVFAFAADDNPAVAALGNGALVAWRAGGSQVGSDLAFRIFDGAGAGGGIIGSARPGDASPPAVAVAPSQDIFVVAEFIQGSGFGVATYIMSVQGFQIGAQSGFIRDTGIGSNARMQVAWLDPSTYAVAVETFYGGARGYEIEMAVYTVTNPPLNSTASPVLLKLPFQVNARSAGNQYGLTMTSLPTGGAVVAWQDGSAPGFSVLLQAFDAGGNRLGAEYRVTNSGEYGVTPAITALADGRVVVTWVGPGDDGSDDIVMQIIDPRDGIVTGGAAADTLYGHDLVNDELSGLGGNDTLFGLGGDDALFGGLGNDLLDGGRGADELYGGRGEDTFILDSLADTVIESATQGIDTVRSGTISLDLGLFPNVEGATLTGALPLSARGNTGANTLNGAANSAANVLTGLSGNDTYIVGAGDTVVEAAGGGIDTVQSATISLNLASYAGIEAITLLGALALKATGNAGANTIDGSQNSAANVLTGLGGNDLFIVGPGDSIVEVAGGGTDTVQSALISLNLALYPGVQNVTLTGALPLSGTGDATANVLDGAQNSAANELTGLGGDDTYILGAGDTLTEGVGGGVDTVRSAAFSLDLQAMPNVENLVLLGTQALTGTGNAAANTLDGAGNPAANLLFGGDGDDLYIIDGLDQVLEFAGKGSDTLQTGLFSLALAGIANMENATLTGALPLSATGTAEANVLNGAANTAANVLTGLDGNDTYVVGAGDTIVETPSGGVDTVQSATLSLNLASYPSVENITLLGSLPLSATGNFGLNLLDGSGNSAANALAGQTGNDVYVVGAGDTVDEPVGGGTDTVFARANHTLKAGSEVEVLLNGALDIGLALTGNALPQSISGGRGNDTLSAGGGGDILYGGAGTDTVIGGVGADMFVFSLFSNSVPGPLRDVIQGFNGAEGDRIDISGMDTNDLLPGNQAFSFLGTSPFTGANGEVRYVASGPDLIVQGVQFPGVTFEIRVAGLGALSAGDFLL